jgi:hypothetical protein
VMFASVFNIMERAGCYAFGLSKLCYKYMTDIWERLSCPLH